MRQARKALASESSKKGQSLGSADKLHFLTSFLLSPAMSIREQLGIHSWPMKSVSGHVNAWSSRLHRVPHTLTLTSERKEQSWLSERIWSNTLPIRMRAGNTLSECYNPLCVFLINFDGVYSLILEDCVIWVL